MAEESGNAIIAFFKKVGMPSLIAAMVAGVVTLVPYLFRLDERYAKAEATDAKLVVISNQLSELTTEVGKLAGTQQVMVSIMSAAQTVRLQEPTRRYVPGPNISTAPANEPVVTGSPPISVSVPKTPAERDKRLDAVSKSLESTQVRVQQIQQQIPSK